MSDLVDPDKQSLSDRRSNAPSVAQDAHTDGPFQGRVERVARLATEASKVALTATAGQEASATASSATEGYSEAVSKEAVDTVVGGC